MRTSQKASLWVVMTMMTLVIAIATASPAVADETATPWWHVQVGSRPTVLTPGRERTVVVSATNLGDGNVNGESAPLVVTDTLPAGVEAEAGKAWYTAGWDGSDG